MHLSLGKVDKSQNQCQEQQQYTSRTHETLFFANGAEDKVSILLGHVLKLCLGAIKESLTLKSARTNGYLTLVYVISSTL